MDLEKILKMILEFNFEWMAMLDVRSAPTGESSQKHAAMTTNNSGQVVHQFDVRFIVKNNKLLMNYVASIKGLWKPTSGQDKKEAAPIGAASFKI